MQLWITSQSLYFAWIQYTAIKVPTKRSSETAQRFLNPNNPKPFFFFKSALKGNSPLVPQAGCLICLPLLWSQIEIFHNLDNSAEVW